MRLSMRNWPPQTLLSRYRGAPTCGRIMGITPGRDEGGMIADPRGFHVWPLERRNVWFAGFNRGFHDRLRLEREEAA